LRCRNVIPHGRGLGSSSAAIVSGVRLAEALAGQSLDDHDVLGLATEIEGHPDNVAACLFGGLTIAWSGDSGPESARLDVHPDIATAVFIPPEPLSTQVARGLLPSEVSHADASANAGRAGLLIAALTARPGLLLDGSEDRLHQGFRASAMPESTDLVARLRESGVAAVISGAGPTVLVLMTADEAVGVDAWTPAGWAGLPLAVSAEGASFTVVE
jgi:homoserine kinase